MSSFGIEIGIHFKLMSDCPYPQIKERIKSKADLKYL